MNDLRIRVSQLEQSLHRLRTVATVSAVAVVAFVALAAGHMRSVPEVVQAQRFELLTPEGKRIGTLSRNAHGHGRFSLSTKGGEFAFLAEADSKSNGRLKVGAKNGMEALKVWWQEKVGGSVMLEALTSRRLITTRTNESRESSASETSGAVRGHARPTRRAATSQSTLCLAKQAFPRRSAAPHGRSENSRSPLDPCPPGV